MKLKNLKIIVTVLLSLLYNNSNAENINYNIENVTLRLYNEQKWDSLIIISKQIQKEKISYYYLEMRFGLAYFFKENYLQAEKHFNVAHKLNNSDEISMGYMYYCYINTGRTIEARALSRKFSVELKNKLDCKKEYGLEFVNVETGFKRTDSATYYDFNQNTASNFFDPAVFFQVGLKHYLKRRLWFYHSLNYFNQNTFINNINQFHYFLKSDIALNNNWVLSPSINFINIATTATVQGAPAPSPPPPPPGMPPPPPPLVPEIRDSSSNTNFISVSIALNKNFKYLFLQNGFTYTNLYNYQQLNNAFTFAVSPLGNSKITVGNTAYIYSTDNYVTTYVATNPFLFVLPHKKLSVKLDYLYNVKQNLIEHNGVLVNNSPDLTRNRFTITPTLYINTHLSIYASYMREYKTEFVQGFNYNYNNGILGLKYQF